MIAVIRYTWSRCLLSQRWIPPIVVYALVIGVLFPTGEKTLLVNGTTGALLLVPVGAFLVMAAINSEDRSQVAIASTAARGYLRARVGVLLAAFSVVLVLGALSIVMAAVRAPQDLAGPDAAEAVALLAIAHLSTAAFGVALGALVARPLIARPGFALLAIAVVCVLGLVVPPSPFRAMIVMLGPAGVGAGSWFVAALVAAEVLLLAAVALAAGLALARRRA